MQYVGQKFQVLTNSKGALESRREAMYSGLIAKLNWTYGRYALITVFRTGCWWFLPVLLEVSMTGQLLTKSSFD